MNNKKSDIKACVIHILKIFVFPMTVIAIIPLILNGVGYESDLVSNSLFAIKIVIYLNLLVYPVPAEFNNKYEHFSILEAFKKAKESEKEEESNE